MSSLQQGKSFPGVQDDGARGRPPDALLTSTRAPRVALS